MVTAVSTSTFAGDYRTEFAITGPGREDSALFVQACDYVQDWFAGLPNSNGQILDSDEFGELAYRRFRTELPHGQNSDVRVSLDVKLATSGERVSVSVRSYLLDGDSGPAPLDLVAGPPTLVLGLFREFECRIGPDRLVPGPNRILPGTAAEFSNRIFNPDRRLPFVVISQNWRGQTPVNPNWLQGLLAGLAEVVTYDNETEEELRRHVGFQLACFGGAMRIYQPGCRRDDDRGRHNFWMPDQAFGLLRRPAGRVVHGIVPHFPTHDSAREFEVVRGQVQRQLMVVAAAEKLAFPLRQQISELEHEIGDLRKELEAGEADASSGDAELHNLHHQLIDRDSELASLRNQLEEAIHRETAHEPEIARLRQQQVERDERIESLRQQLESAISRADTGQSEIAQLHNQLLERDGQVESLRRELDDAVHRETEAGQDIALLKLQIQEDDAKIESLRQQMETLSIQEYVSRSAIAQLQSSLQERDGEVGTLHAQLQSALSRSEEIDDLVGELNKELRARDTDITTLRLLLEGVEGGSEDTETVIAGLRRELQEREEDARAITAHLENARNRANAAESAAAELRRELEQRLSESSAIGNIIEQRQMSPEDAHVELADTHRAFEGLNARINELQEEVLRLEQERGDAQEELLNKDIAYEDLEEQVRDKDDEIRRLRYRLNEPHSDEWLDLALSEEPLPIENIGEALMYAQQRFDMLKFLPSAFDSAVGYPYLHPGRVYNALSALQRIAAQRQEGPLGTSVEQRLLEEMQHREFEYTPRESEPTMQRHGDARWFEGHEMQEHIKLGSGTSNKQHYIRIHFCWSGVEKKYFIGHVGEHLPTVSGG